MNDAKMLEQFALTDAYAPETDMPASAWSRDTAFSEIERRIGMQTQTAKTSSPPPPMRQRGWLIAAAAFAVVILVVGAVILLAQPADELPPATTPPTTVVSDAGSSSWETVVLDSVGVTGQQATVLVSSDGVPVVVYQREVASDEAVVKLARCVDPACSDVTVIELTDPVRGRLGGAVLLPDDSPVFLFTESGGSGEISEGTLVVSVCSDPACSSLSDHRIAGASPMGVAVQLDGAPVFAFLTWDDGPLLYFGFCDDRDCASHTETRVEIEEEFSGIGNPEVRVLPDGSPVLFFDSGGPGSAEGETRHLLVCTDPACTSTITSDFVEPPIDGAATPSDLPLIAYVANLEVVHLIGCLDEHCVEASVLDVYRQFEGTVIVAADAVIDTDRSPFLAVHTIPLSELTMDGTHQILAVDCDDPICGSVSTGILGDGNHVSIAVFPDGGFAVATQTGRPILCLEDCVDPDDTDLSTLTLYLCLGAGCAASATSDVVTAAGSVETPRDAAIAFSTEGDIYILGPETTTSAKLTDSPSWDGAPVWSPDGTRIAFHSDRNATEADEFQNYDIYIMDADGTNVTQVTNDPAGEFFPEWSPDGTRLVFARQSDTDDRYLVIVELDSNREFRLTDQTRPADLPAWSPDGSSIAFSGRTSGDCSWEGTDCNVNIYLINVDGSDLTQLTDSNGINAFPAWSPDGREIVFHTTRNDPSSTIWEISNWDIYVMSHDGVEVSALTDYAGADQMPSWSPDGKTIVFQSDRTGIPRLYTMTRINGFDATLIAPDIQYAEFPDWSPIGIP